MSAPLESVIVPPMPKKLQPKSGWMIVLAIGENVAENGAFGVAVAVGVFVGGMSEKEVAVGIEVKVAGGVSVAVIKGGLVAVQVAWS